MLGRLIGKLLFKACVPLVGLLGVMTYGVYLKGGDPAAMWKHVASGAFDQVGASLSKAKNEAVGVADNIAGSTGLANSGSGSGSGNTKVFTWKDEEGVTHFGTTAPSDVAATTLSVDPNVNVLAPVVATRVVDKNRSENGNDAATVDQINQSFAAEKSQSNSGRRTARGSSGNQAVQQLEAEMGAPLPGVAGQILSNGGSGGNGVDPTQLIRMLQSSGN